MLSKVLTLYYLLSSSTLLVVGFTYIMSSSDSSCYTVVFESSAEYPSASELRSGLEKGSDEVKIDTLRKIIVSTINGNSQVSDILFFSYSIH